jgi:hypothetical protein
MALESKIVAEDLPGEAPAAYRTPSVLAVGALLVALASPLALLHLLAWAVPVVAVVVAILALRRIAASEGELVGRGLALVALALGLFCGVAAVTHYYTHLARLEAEADAVVRQWSAALATGDVPVAHQWTVRAEERAPEDQRTWVWYQRSASIRRDLRRFVKEPVVRALLELGAEADVRHFATERWAASSKAETLWLVYAVTYSDGDRRKSFFFRSQLVRTDGVWEVMATEGPYRPEVLERAS